MKGQLITRVISAASVSLTDGTHAVQTTSTQRSVRDGEGAHVMFFCLFFKQADKHTVNPSDSAEDASH